MDQHLNYITLGVADLAASRRFYRDIFGWQERADSNDNIISDCGCGDGRKRVRRRQRLSALYPRT